MGKVKNKANEQVINNAFLRFRMTKEEIIRAGMYGLLESAVHVALEAHDDVHRAHIDLGDTYGWMLVHNRNIQELVVVSTPQNRGEATEQLQNAARRVPSKGWVGVVMAGLQPAMFFSVDYEMGILDRTIQVTKQNFSQYFKKL